MYYIFLKFCFEFSRSDDNVVHIMLRFLNGQFDAGGGTRFSQLADLVDYYKKNPMIEKAGGSVVHLKAVSRVPHRRLGAIMCARVIL